MTLLQIRDVAPRDGLQDQAEIIPTERKVQLVRRLYDAGLRSVEVTSFVSRKRVPQLADAEELCARLRDEHLDGLISSAFVATAGGLTRAIDAGVDEISTTVPATDSMTQANFARDRAQMTDEVVGMRAEAGADASVTIAVAFACPYEGPVAPERVISLFERLAEGGYTTILLGDTIGYANPRSVGSLVEQIATRFPEVTVGAHFHDARGSAVANVVAAVNAGATLVDAALGGLGGCPFAPGAAGNVATEDITWVLGQAGFELALDPYAVADAARWLPDGLGVPMRGRAGEATKFEWEG